MTLFLNTSAILISALATITIFISVLINKDKFKKISIGLMGLIFILVSIIMIDGFITHDMNYFRLWYLVPLLWILLLFGFILFFWLKHYIFFLAIAPISFFILFTATLTINNEANINNDLNGPVFWLHLSLVFGGIACMALAACSGIIFLWQEKALKKKLKLSSRPKGLPALGSLDKLNAIFTYIGFPLYFLGVFAGFIWAYAVWGEFFSFDPKEIFSIIILALYAYLFHRRQKQDFTGRKPAILAIIIFFASLFSIVIVNTFLTTHHGF